MIKFQQSQALTSHFESFWSIVPSDGLVNHVHGKFVFFKNFDCEILLLFFHICESRILLANLCG